MFSKKYKLYWIYDNRIPHQDPMTDGYIGVTSSTLGQRLANHKSDVANVNADGSVNPFRKMYHILKRIPDENIVIKEIVWSYDQKNVAVLEEALRPRPDIGWNTHKGGKAESTHKDFVIEWPNGRMKRYKKQTEAVADGFNSGNLSQLLHNKPGYKTICQRLADGSLLKGCKAYYAL